LISRTKLIELGMFFYGEQIKESVKKLDSKKKEDQAASFRYNFSISFRDTKAFLYYIYRYFQNPAQKML